MAISAQAGVLPVVDVATSWGTHAWGPTLVNHWGGPSLATTWGAHGAPWGAHAAPWGLSPWGVPSVLGGHGPVLNAAHGHVVGPVVGVHGHGHGHEG